MPVVVFSSPKGGCGKTTAAVLLATELAERGLSVVVIDADPNRNVAEWSKLPGVPAGLTVVSNVDKHNILDQIDAAVAKASFVIVDMEGTADLMVAHAISVADFVLIPVQGSQLDAKQAWRQVKLIKDQERVARRRIPYAMLFTRTSPVIQPRTLGHIKFRFAEGEIPVLATQLTDREAYRAVFSFGGTLTGLDTKQASGLDQALANARAYVGEVVETLRALTVA